MESNLMILLLIIVGTVCFLAPYTTAFNREYSHSRFACLARNARNRRPLSKGRHSGKFHGARDELLGDSGKKKRKNFNKSKPKPSPKYTSKLMSLTRDVLNSFFSDVVSKVLNKPMINSVRLQFNMNFVAGIRAPRKFGPQ